MRITQSFFYHPVLSTMSKYPILIAFGGISPEHEVSVLTALQAKAALESTNLPLLPLYISKTGQWFTGQRLFDLESYKDLRTLEQNATPCTFTVDKDGRTVLREESSGLFHRPKSHPIDTVLIAFHGSSGENGAFQGVCEQFNLPYTGSDVASSAIGMDKIRAKQLCRQAGIPVVDDVTVNETTWVQNTSDTLEAIQKLGYPVIVKPARLGSSIGVHRCTSDEETKTAIEDTFRYDEWILVEKAIHPLTEINCSVMGTPDNPRASVCEQPLGSDAHLTFQDKYQSGRGKGMAAADRIIPANIPDELAATIQSSAKTIFQTLGASGIARLDFLLQTDTNTFYFNEINTIPGSFSFYLWKESGITFDQLLLESIGIAKLQHQKRTGRVRSYETNLLSEKAASGIKGLKGAKGLKGRKGLKGAGGLNTPTGGSS